MVTMASPIRTGTERARETSTIAHAPHQEGTELQEGRQQAWGTQGPMVWECLQGAGGGGSSG